MPEIKDTGEAANAVETEDTAKAARAGETTGTAEATGVVKAVCVSEARGVQKRNVRSAALSVESGVANDAHGRDWRRQVSLLSYDKIKEFNNLGADVKHGDFGENLVVEGINFSSLPVGTQLKCGEVILEITQIGKECHTHCQIYQKMGDCIMPREGVFARVKRDGGISVGDLMEIVGQADRRFRAAVLTLSDKGAAGEREDKSGPAIYKMLVDAGYSIDDQILLADDRRLIESELINLCDRRRVDLVVTTGGTGFSRRDVTPEA
ncbi:MAG: molybdopterin-binding protein, partial [Oscillospiraceae bacterium]|nr:molybdopterin-binding protein [Oscillospiraceae bacterium]